MKLLWRLGLGLVAVLVAAPLVYFSALGSMKPLQGFCGETGLADNVAPLSAEEEAQSYFNSPELGHRWSYHIVPFVAWPVCTRTQRGEHRIWNYGSSRNLSRLSEPNLRRLHLTNPKARVFRVLTAPSFSRLPIALRAEETATGLTIHASWLEDSGVPAPTDGTPAAAPGYEEWRFAPLPRKSLTRTLTEAEAHKLAALLEETMSEESVFQIAIDGTRFIIESVDGGRRRVRVHHTSWESDKPWNLYCAMVELSNIPKQALEQGHSDFCG